MRVWVDLANSPHVALFERVVAELRARGDDVFLTARDHAQTVPLAERLWPDVLVVGGASPAERAGKARTLAARAVALGRVARRRGVDVALSHGSYAQLAAASAVGIPGVTMMDYEYQPANHVSFRLARQVIVPEVFPAAALRRFGAARKAVRYEGFKEDLVLAWFESDREILVKLGLDPSAIVAVLRPPPEGALYHRGPSSRFDEILGTLVAAEGVEAVVLPRDATQAQAAAAAGARVLHDAVDARSLADAADLVVGGGGTMSREAALLGTPAYTVFAGRLAAVDAELIRLGLLHDLRAPRSTPRLEKKELGQRPASRGRARAILETVLRVLDEVAR